MELVAYLVVLALAMALATTRKPISLNLRTAIAFLAFMALAIVVRFNGFDADVEVYAAGMSKGVTGTALMEPVLRLGQRGLFAVFRNEIFVLILYDAAAFALLLAAFRNFKLPAYAFVAIICFFPFIIGQQNILRQWVASIFVIYALSVANSRNVLLPAGAVVLSALTHSAAALLAGFVVAERRWNLRGYLYGFAVVAAPGLMLVGQGSKVDTATGASLEYAYLVLVTLLAGFIWYRTGAAERRRESVQHVLFFAVYVVFWSSVLLPSALSERTSMYVILILYPALVKAVEKTGRWRIPMRVALVVLGFVPILVFGTRKFIL